MPPEVSTLEEHSAVTKEAARLSAGLEALGINASDAQRVRLTRLLALLDRWNGVFNLTAIRHRTDMLPAHLLDSLSICGVVDRFAPTTVVDVGSGAGFPGIPLAIVRPELQVITVDAVGKKISFQKQAKSNLAIDNLQPTASRVEALTLSESPDVIVSRAYATIPDMLASIVHLAGPSTAVIAMKGVRPDDELRCLPTGWRTEDVVPLDVPFLGAQRCAVVLRRTGERDAARASGVGKART